MYDFKKVEEDTLEFWKKNKIFEKARSKNKGKKPFYFLDGPPYTSGRVHIGTAWNKALKDLVLRYKRMQGFDVWDRAGYDMHGLPIEHQVEKKFNLKTKEDVEKFGVAKFVEQCEKFAVDNMLLMNKDFQRIGVWMDFENAYQSIAKEYVEGVWQVIKEAEKKGRLYEGNRAMHWCASCATALAKHELEYQNIVDQSIYLKFKVKGNKDEYLLIWTTTPWTIKFNMAVMVNPEVTYVKVLVEDEVWIVAEPLAHQVVEKVAGKKLNIIEKLKGKDLEGVEYLHPFEDLIPHYKDLRKSTKIHYVVSSKEYVDTESGTGLVHTAPGCGPEDYEIGIRNKLPIFNNLDEYGVFPHDMGIFKDMKAKKDDKKIVEILDDQKALLATQNVNHEYAHCQRCHDQIIYKATKQWFLKVEDLKEKMIKDNQKITWVPKAAFNAFDSWLKNLRDNSITKQRYWGSPLPIWRCTNCDSVEVLSSVAEIEKRSKQKVEKIHKPWIDEIKFDCKECTYKMQRIPDVLDVWLDAGSASWTCLDYPQKKELFDKLFPADFILEGVDQIRGWFNLLMVLSELQFDKPSFKAAYMHGFVQDTKGRKMSKSLGNYILPEEVIEKYGADTLRYYMIGGSNPGIDLNYNFEDMKVKFRNLGIFLNVARLLSIYSQHIKKEYTKDIEEQYIFSKLHSNLKKLTESLDNYRLNEAPDLIEEIILELSRTYIQFTREKMAKEPEKVASTIAEVLIEILKAFSIVAPFISEYVYHDLKDKLSLKEESIHLYDWPKYNEKLINKKLEAKIETAKDVIQELLAQREKEKIGIRWPLQKAVIVTKDKEIIEAIKDCKNIILTQVNVKDIEIQQKEISKSFEAGLDTELTPELEMEGFARELTRRIQNIRKKQRMQKEEKILLAVESDYNLEKLSKQIQEKVGAKTVAFTKPTKKYEITSEEKIKEQIFKIHIEKQ